MLGTTRAGIQIPVPSTPSTFKRETKCTRDHFDPTSSTPPDNFLVKLNARMKVYEEKHFINMKQVTRN